MTLVTQFHTTFGQDAPGHPTPASTEILQLRARLIDEEFKEVKAELDALLLANRLHALLPAKLDIMRKLLKELADLRYVVDGCAVALGLDIDGAFAEVHRSNMSKLDKDGNVLYRPDGKVLKSDQYTVADMHLFIPHIIDIEEVT